MKTSCIALIVASALAVHTAHGYPKYLDELPNGANMEKKLGHSGEEKTAFGKAFGAVGSWSKAFCNEKFPGSSITNGQAFGDPCCTWTKGGKPQFEVSFAADFPAASTETCPSAGGPSSGADVPAVTPAPSKAPAITPGPAATPAPAAGGDGDDEYPSSAPATATPVPAPAGVDDDDDDDEYATPTPSAATGKTPTTAAPSNDDSPASSSAATPAPAADKGDSKPPNSKDDSSPSKCATKASKKKNSKKDNKPKHKKSKDDKKDKSKESNDKKSNVGKSSYAGKDTKWPKPPGSSGSPGQSTTAAPSGSEY